MSRFGWSVRFLTTAHYKHWVSFLSGHTDLDIMNLNLLVFTGVLLSPKPNSYDGEDLDLPKLSTHRVLPLLQRLSLARDMVHGVPRFRPGWSCISSPDVLASLMWEPAVETAGSCCIETRHISFSCTQTWEAQQLPWVAAFYVKATIFLCAVLERAA